MIREWLRAGVVVGMSVACAAVAQHPMDVQAEYTWDHSNLLPGCNCFGMQGGSGEFGVGMTPRLSALVDVTVVHHGGITPSGYALTQRVFAGGVRYEPRLAFGRVKLFGEVLAGASHASGTLSPSVGGFGGNTAFALETGGGAMVPLSRRWTLVPARVDYMLTTFGNGSANRQNQLRLSGGVRFRFGN